MLKCRHLSKMISFLIGQPRPLFPYFRSLQTALYKNCGLQRDLTTDYWRRQQAGWPLDHQHYEHNSKLFSDIFKVLASISRPENALSIWSSANNLFYLTLDFDFIFTFQTESLSLQDLLLLAGLSSSVFVICELKKFLERYSLKELFNMTSSKARIAKKGSGYAV